MNAGTQGLWLRQRLFRCCSPHPRSKKICRRQRSVGLLLVQTLPPQIADFYVSKTEVRGIKSQKRKQDKRCFSNGNINKQHDRSRGCHDCIRDMDCSVVAHSTRNPRRFVVAQETTRCFMGQTGSCQKFVKHWNWFGIHSVG